MSQERGLEWLAGVGPHADLTPLAPETPVGEPHLCESLQHFSDLTGEDEGRQVNQHRRPQPRANIGRTARKIAELRVEGEGNPASQLGIHPVCHAVRCVECEPRCQCVNPQVVLFIAEDGPPLGGEHGCPTPDLSSRFESR